MFALLLALSSVQPVSLVTLLPADPAAPGCAVDVRRHGVVLAAQAIGRANLETPAPITDQTVFEIGSVSKQFIGAGLALLADRGKLSLDDHLRRWLPELPPLYRDVTLRMLANHTSGIRNWNNLAELTGRGEDSTGYDNRWVLAAVARQRRLNNAPGAEYLYSNSNFVLAAMVIERASGEELNAFYRHALFDRLGMARTRWRTDFRDLVPGRAQAYSPDDHGGWRLDMPLNGVAGAGGLLSTVGDLQRWNAALADPAPADRTWVAMLQTPGRLADGTTLRYAMGLELDPIAGRPAVGHAGATGSYRGWLSRHPTEEVSVALLCNSGAVNTQDLGPQVAALYLTPAVAAPPAPATGPVSGAVAPELAGLYRNAANDGVVEATIEDGAVRFSGGPPFRAAGGTLTTSDGSRHASVTRMADGRIGTIVLSRPGNAPARLVRVAAWQPSTAELARLAGEYGSPEIDGVQRIVLRGGALTWVDPAGDEHPLTPVYRDAFEARDASWTLRFGRDRDGGANVVDFSITRARRIGFKRLSHRSAESRP